MRRGVKLTMWVVAFGLVIAGMTSCKRNASRAVVRVGFINSITGPEAPIGENLTNGALLAIEDVKRAGIDVQLVQQDDTGKPDKAIAAIEQLATIDKVAGVVGPYTSACANAVAKQAEQYQVAQLIPAASKEEITRQGYQWVFRLNAPSHVYAESLLDAALAFGSPKSIAFIYESTDFGSTLAKTGQDIAKRRGLEVVADESYQKGSPDYRSTLTKVKEKAPHLVFLVSYVADAILLMRQSRELGLKPQAFLGGGAGFDTAQFEAEKDISTNVFSVSQWTKDTNWSGAADFDARYRQRFGKKPAYHAACAYVATKIMAEAAAKQNGDRKQIRDALASGRWDGILGDVQFKTFDGFTNQNQHEMVVVQYQGGNAVTVWPKKLARAEAVYPFPGW
ncbi:MAG TPA: ABC transporter substrate-binding protein [Polyangiaceae bacterium]